MKKTDLRGNHVIERKTGTLELVIPDANTLLVLDEDLDLGFNLLDNLRDDLTDECGDEFDVVRVREVVFPSDICPVHWETLPIIWERKDV